jgi:hypothetical protein
MGDVDETDLAYGRDRWRVLVKAIKDSQDLKMKGIS